MRSIVNWSVSFFVSLLICIACVSDSSAAPANFPDWSFYDTGNKFRIVDLGNNYFVYQSLIGGKIEDGFVNCNTYIATINGKTGTDSSVNDMCNKGFINEYTNMIKPIYDGNRCPLPFDLVKFSGVIWKYYSAHKKFPVIPTKLVVGKTYKIGKNDTFTFTHSKGVTLAVVLSNPQQFIITAEHQFCGDKFTLTSETPSVVVTPIPGKVIPELKFKRVRATIVENDAIVAIAAASGISIPDGAQYVK